MQQPMQPTQALTADQQFFFDRGAWSYDPKTETNEQGRTRCAVALAEAEALYLLAHQRADVHISWAHDEQGHYDARRSGGGEDYDTIEVASLVHDGRTMDCIGSITDADANYRRVTRAELAMTCEAELRAILESNGE